MRNNEEIKKILNAVINGTVYYECHNTKKANGCTECSCNCGEKYDLHCGINYWHEYELGKEIHKEDDWEYLTEEELNKLYEEKSENDESKDDLSLAKKIINEWLSLPINCSDSEKWGKLIIKSKDFINKE